MTIELFPPMAIHERGARPHNEDAIYPALGRAGTEDRLFIVCDGVGGAEKGEIASRLACLEMVRFFESNIQGRISDQDLLDAALQNVESVFDQYLLENPQSRGMATTLCLLHLHAAGATLAHIGDSRLYHMRAGKVLWQSQDHSLVNQLLNKGALTRHEAEHHPHQHVITRAIQGRSQKATKVDVHLIRDLRANDYFFLCSDGILENFSDEALAYFVTSPRPDAEKIEGIRQKCMGNPNDNFSAYLIHIGQIDGADTSTPMTQAVLQVEQAEIVEAEINGLDFSERVVEAIVEEEDDQNDQRNFTYATET
ncbi:MAG: protein phosphatase 2C domain-containing protein [Bacteroidota bacterium]